MLGPGKKKLRRACPPRNLKDSSGERGTVSPQEYKGQREEIPRSQVSDHWDHLIRKWPAGKGGECLIFGGIANRN